MEESTILRPLTGAIEMVKRKKAKGYQICRRCIMDTIDPDIEFDENGYCNHCRSYLKRISTEAVSEAERPQKLERLEEDCHYVLNRLAPQRDFLSVILLDLYDVGHWYVA